MRVPLLVSALPVAFAIGLPRFKNLVTFGDSYTDVVVVGDGGVAWPVYAAGYAHLTLHPFARSGAACSNDITPINSPPVMESQIPAFQAAKLRLPPQETVYTLWIGTNDVGASGLLTGKDPGVTVVDTTACAVDWVRVMYRLGARNFIFQNMIPLQLTELYSATALPSRPFHTDRNQTEWALMMTEMTTAGNAISLLMLRALAPTLRGARIVSTYHVSESPLTTEWHTAYFDSHALFSDMFAHPARYLNGTAPLNVTGSINGCPFELNGGPVGGACPTPVQGTDRDSFLWFDELHPSEQADRVVAREIVAAMRGDTRWATWIS